MDIKQEKRKLAQIVTAINNEKIILTKLQKEVAETRKTVKSLIIEKDKENKEIEKITETKKNIDEKLKDIKAVLLEKKKEVNEFEKQIKELDLESIEGIKTMNAQLDLVNKAIKEEKDGFKIDEANYEREIEKLSIKKDEIIKVSRILENDNDTLLNRNLELEKETIEYSKMIAFDIEEMKKNKQAIEKAKDLLRALKADCAILVGNKDKVEQSIEDIKKEKAEEIKMLNIEKVNLEEMKRYRFALIKKGRTINRALEFIIDAYKNANIPLESIEPINIPEE